MTRELNKLVYSIGKRYGTFNPFVWAERLNLDIKWMDLGSKPLGTTTYYGSKPIIALTKNIRYSKQRYFVLAHELGHVLEHEGLSAYYISNNVHKRKTEREADNFAMTLVTNLYMEENGHLPDTYEDLRHNYGCPYLGNKIMSKY